MDLQLELNYIRLKKTILSLVQFKNMNLGESVNDKMRSCDWMPY